MGQEDREMLTIYASWSSGCEGIDDLDTRLLEIGAVAGGTVWQRPDRERGGGCDEAVLDRHGAAGSAKSCQ